jgi:glutamate-1-semialdehyde-2,1-aminomutase
MTVHAIRVVSEEDRFRHSADLTRRARALYPSGVTRVSVGTAPIGAYEDGISIYAQSGSGAFVEDVDGNRYLDFHNNFSTLVHGHAHPAVIQAIQGQLQRGVCFGNPTEADLDLAAALCDRIPAIERIRFLNSGTEAVMFAIKAARAITGRRKIAKFEGAFHGTYDWAEVSVRSNPENWGKGAVPHSTPPYLNTPDQVLRDVVTLPFNDLALTRAILDEHGDEIACILVDVMPCAAGMVPVLGDYLANLQELARHRDILVISDEVVCFRLGYSGSSALAGLDPDLVTLGKVIGGGLPIGAVGGKQQILSIFAPQDRAPVPQGGTFSANPLTMAAGLAALNGYSTGQVEHVNRLGDRLRQGVEEVANATGVPLIAMGAGSLFRLHLKRRRPTTYREAFASPKESEALRRLNTFVLMRGFQVAFPFWGAVSTVMSEAHIDAFVDAIRESVLAMPDLRGLQ